MVNPPVVDAGPEYPDLWAVAAHNKIPEDAWEYHMRKQLNDAAYRGLDYLPYCSTMPVQKVCDEPKFMWTKKKAQGGH